MKKSIKNLLLVCICLYMPAQSMAWGLLGHRVVAQIAEQHLTPKARKEIHKILGPQPMAIFANWMDFIKSDHSFDYMSSWHYADLPGGLSYEQFKTGLDKDTVANAYNKILFVSSELKKKDLPLAMKQMYLKILIHLAGDVHQPLHVGHENDKGGNDVKVKWFGKQENLHSLWDSELIDSQQLSYTEYASALDHPSKAEISAWQKDSLSQWLFGSYTVANELYKEAENNTNYSYRYNFDHIDELNQQLLKGGIRLAGLLNDIFG